MTKISRNLNSVALSALCPSCNCSCIRSRVLINVSHEGIIDSSTLSYYHYEGKTNKQTKNQSIKQQQNLSSGAAKLSQAAVA